MSIKAVFAANLRSLCKRDGSSIAALCQRVGIPRNQMIRHLAGKHLPNEHTRKLLCEYFGVSELAMFSANGTDFVPAASAFDDEECRALMSRLLAGEASKIAEGSYETFFPTASNPKRLMVSLTVVKRAGEKLVFRRITRSWQGRNSRNPLFRGDHSGFVVDRFGAHYFLGLNKVAPHEPSLAILHPLPLGDLMLGGRALIVTERGTSSLPIVMRAIKPPATLRETLKSLGQRSITDKTIEPFVAQFIRSPTF